MFSSRSVTQASHEHHPSSTPPPLQAPTPRSAKPVNKRPVETSPSSAENSSKQEKRSAPPGQATTALVSPTTVFKADRYIKICHRRRIVYGIAFGGTDTGSARRAWKGTQRGCFRPTFVRCREGLIPLNSGSHRAHLAFPHCNYVVLLSRAFEASTARNTPYGHRALIQQPSRRQGWWRASAALPCAVQLCADSFPPMAPDPNFVSRPVSPGTAHFRQA